MAVLGAAVTVALAGACSSAPPLPPPPPAVVQAPARPAPPPLPLEPVRWAFSHQLGQPALVHMMVNVKALTTAWDDRVSVLGPRTAEGTYVLVAGRRTLLTKDGGVRAETVPLPQALVRLVAVPTKAGPRLVGASLDTVYRFDDPLGEGTPIASGLMSHIGWQPDDPLPPRLATLPGTVVVWTGVGPTYIVDPEAETARFLDVETGRDVPPPPIVDLPLIDAAFVSPREGAAVFMLRGLAVTTDGGATWRTPASKTLLDLTRLASDLGQLRARRGNATAAVDAAAASVGALEERDPRSLLSSLHPSTKWSTDSDPLERAVKNGIAAPDGGAWIASADQVLHVNLENGDVSPVASIPEAHPGGSRPRIVRAGDAVWIGYLPKPHAGSAVRGRLVRGTTEGGTLKLGDPEPLDVDGSDLRGSPAGGLAIGNRVRQPDGSWKTIPRSASCTPLVDGRVACIGPGGELRVFLVDAAGAEEASPPLDLRGVSRASAMEEDRDHVLHFTVETAEGAAVVALPLPFGSAPPRVTRVRGASQASVHGGRGIAAGKGKLLASLDGGETWSEVPAPRHLLDQLDGSRRSPWPTVGEVGAQIGDALRLGWGPSAAPPPGSQSPIPAPTPPAGASGGGTPPTGKLHLLSCQSKASAAQSVPVLDHCGYVAYFDSDDGLWFNRPEPPHVHRQHAGIERRDCGARTSRIFDASAELVQEGPAWSEDTGEHLPPRKWTLRWVDPNEIGSRMRTWSGAPALPKDAGDPWYQGPADLAVKEDRALFLFLDADMKDYVVRTSGAGQLQVARAPWQTAYGPEIIHPLRSVAFGSGPGAPIAFVHVPDDGDVFPRRLYVWRAGEAPRAVATLPPASILPLESLSIGEPTDDGVPLLLTHGDVRLTRVLPIPEAKASPEPPLLTADGWARPPVSVDPRRLPACDAKAGGLRFAREVDDAAAILDGTRYHAPSTRFDLRLSGGDACVAGVREILDPKDPQGSARFVRADLVGRRAEGGELGDEKVKVKVKTLTCSWVEAPSTR